MLSSESTGFLLYIMTCSRVFYFIFFIRIHSDNRFFFFNARERFNGSNINIINVRRSPTVLCFQRWIPYGYTWLEAKCRRKGTVYFLFYFFIRIVITTISYTIRKVGCCYYYYYYYCYTDMRTDDQVLGPRYN